MSAEFNTQVIKLLTDIQSRLSIIESKINSNESSTSSSTTSTTITLPKSIQAYDEYTALYLDPFLTICNKLGGGALESGLLIKDAWNEMRKFLLMSTYCKEPTQVKLNSLLIPLTEKVKACNVAVKRNEWEKHTKTLSEGVGCLSWLVVKPAPRDFIESYIGGSDYWANNIRKEYKVTNPDHIEFCNRFKTLLQELMIYVKEYHTTGVTWNNKNGIDVNDYNPNNNDNPVTTTASTSTTATVAPVIKATTAAAAAVVAPVAAKVDLFAALNREDKVTVGLKKVTKDMQTWRAEYKADDTTLPTSTQSKLIPKSSSNNNEVVMKYPPKCEFQNSTNKWQVEYQTSSCGIVTIEIKDKKETVYILGCIGANININGKCKSIIVDNCKKTNVTFNSIMASCEIVNCQRMNIICTETVSAVAIDKTDGIVVTLPKTSLTTEIVASKSSEMNVSWPDENGDMIERPIPEQYVHRISGLSITANVSDLYH